MSAAAFAGGCAGGAWLDSPLPGELATDPPKSAYPTAITSASGKAPAQALPAITPAQADNQAAAIPAQSASQRLNRSQPMQTPLAVIPAQYVHAPASQPAVPSVGPANMSLVSAPVATSQSPVPAATHPLSATTSLPQLDLSFLDVLAAAPSTAKPAVAPPASVAVAPNVEDTERNNVKLAAHESTDSPAPHDSLEKAQNALIDALEAQIRLRRDAGATDEELPRLEQQLRLVYAAAGRMDDAVSAVESLDASQKEAYKNLMFGMGVWLSPDEARRAALRTAKVLHSLRDATADLAGASKLELKNLAFCERVEHFGWYTEFPRKEFQPKQQVILYAEVENFSADQKGPSSYETELQGSYVILDASGQEIASRQLQLDKEVCRNYRRDYFLAYRIYLPDGISPGRYRLELTVEDLKARGKYQGRKLGEGVIEFTIR